MSTRDSTARGAAVDSKPPPGIVVPPTPDPAPPNTRALARPGMSAIIYDIVPGADTGSDGIECTIIGVYPDHCIGVWDNGRRFQAGAWENVQLLNVAPDPEHVLTDADGDRPLLQEAAKSITLTGEVEVVSDSSPPPGRFHARRPDPSAPPPDPAPHTPDWMLLLDQVAFLRDTISPTRPEDGEVLAALRTATAFSDSIETEDDPPSAATLRAALDTFFSLPADVRRKLLGGWTMERWPERVEDCYGHGTYNPQLVITAGGRWRNGLPIASHDLALEDSTSPVHLHIRFGTTKEQAIAGLIDLLQTVQTNWRQLTEFDPTNLAQ